MISSRRYWYPTPGGRLNGLAHRERNPLATRTVKSGERLRRPRGASTLVIVRLACPLIGRSQEMRLIAASLADDDSTGMVVTGAAGVGKTRIVREALRAAQRHGYETRWVAGTYSARAVPLGALAGWLGTSDAGTSNLVHDVIGALTSARPGASVVVVVDDAHLLDDVSAFVVHQLIVRRAAKVLITAGHPDPAGPAAHPLWPEHRLGRLDLQPLSREETALLAASLMDGDVDPDTATRLWELTRGNPLYLRTVVDLAIADGRLVADGHWRWAGAPPRPGGLAEGVASCMADLPEPVADVVDALAVAEPLDVRLLSRIAGPAALEDAETRGLVALCSRPDGVDVRLTHPLHGEIRRRQAGPARLRRVRRLVAAALACRADRDDPLVLVRRATLRLDSDLEADPGELIRAARAAVRLVDLPLADALAAAAIGAGAGPEASVLRGYVLSWLSRGREAEAVYADTPLDGLSDADRAGIVGQRVLNRLFTLADPAGAKELIDAATPAASASGRAVLDGFRAVYWAAMGRPAAALEAAADAAWRDLPDGVAVRMTAWALSVAYGDSGHTTGAVTAAEAGYLDCLPGFDVDHVRFLAADGHVGALLLAGRVFEALDAAERLGRRAVDVPPAGRLHSDSVAGRAALGAGRLETASSLLGPVVLMLSEAGDTNGWEFRCRIPHTVALAMRGLGDEAAAAFAELDARRHPGWRCLDYELELARAWVLAASGAVGAAITSARAAAEIARGNGQFGAEVLCLQTAAQFGDGSCAVRLHELAALVQGPRAAIAARFADALRDGDADRLTAASEDFSRMGDLVAAMDACAHAALMYRRRNARGLALQCSTWAETLAEKCGSASTPALCAAVTRLPLTTRERQIVRLLSAGLSSREVARQLTVSVRTVEGHIYRAMAKTGSANRQELVELLTRHGRR